MGRGRAYHRKQAARARRRMKRLASFNAPSYGMIVTNQFDDATFDLVDLRAPKQYWFQNKIRFCKRESKRRVRRATEVGQRSAYKKEFDIGWTIW